MLLASSLAKPVAVRSVVRKMTARALQGVERGPVVVAAAAAAAAVERQLLLNSMMQWLAMRRRCKN